jgi:hypothetical protein
VLRVVELDGHVLEDVAAAETFAALIFFARTSGAVAPAAPWTGRSDPGLVAAASQIRFAGSVAMSCSTAITAEGNKTAIASAANHERTLVMACSSLR